MIASVPLQGTYLPYSICAKLPKKWIKFPSPCRGLIFFTLDMPSVYHVCAGFRPLTGDLSSLLTQWKVRGWIYAFPSPYRGLIFFTNMKNSVKKENKFPSPYRGLIFFTGYYDTARKINKMFPSPYRGLIFFTVYLEWSFSGQGFPSPYRGLIFLT